MKKNKFTYLLGIAMLGAITLTSCSKDDDESTTPIIENPTPDATIKITLLENPVSVNPGESVTIVGSFVSTKEMKSVQLRSMFMKLDEVTTFPNNTFVLTLNTSLTEGGFSVTHRIIAEDVDGNKVEEPITINYNEFDGTFLEDQKELQFYKTSQFNGIGMEIFGLKWDRNESDYAVIEKDEADKLVELSNEAYNNIKTVEALKDAIDAAEDKELYGKIASDHSSVYPEAVIGVKNGDEYFILKFTHTNFASESADDPNDPNIEKLHINGVYRK